MRPREFLAATAVTAAAVVAILGAGTASQAAAQVPAEKAATVPAVTGQQAANASAEPAGGSVKGLKVLIVNDDSIQGTAASGSDGRGLYALRKAMCAAGADVLTVGPWTVQSGMGGRITLTGPATVQQVTPPVGYTDDCGNAPSGGRVFGVCAAVAPCVAASDGVPASPSASPSDAVIIALTRFIPENYWAGGPDIVLSGINFGQNDALTVYHSGTVSALVTAHRLGVPGVAFSEELTTDCLAGRGSCPEFTEAAAFATRLVGALRRERLIKPTLALNVNYPHLEAGQTARRPVLNVLGRCTAINFGPTGSVPASGGTYTLGLIPPCRETTRNADTTALAQRHISLVPLDGDWTLRGRNEDLRKLVRGLA